MQPQLLSLQFTAIIHNDMRFLTCQCYPSHFLEELTPYSPTSALLRFAGFCVFLFAFWRSRLCRSCCYNSNYKLNLKWTQKLKIWAGFWMDMRWLRKWHPITNWRPLALWSHSPQILPHSPAASEGLSFPPMSWTGTVTVTPTKAPAKAHAAPTTFTAIYHNHPQWYEILDMPMLPQSFSRGADPILTNICPPSLCWFLCLSFRLLTKPPVQVLLLQLKLQTAFEMNTKTQDLRRLLSGYALA